MIVDVSKAVALLSNCSLIKLLKSKELSHRVSTKAWPTILDIEVITFSNNLFKINLYFKGRPLPVSGPKPCPKIGRKCGHTNTGTNGHLLSGKFQPQF